MKNYYEILEVHENASSEIIQKVYKILAKKYHPDVQEGNEIEEAEAKFKEIAEAYETLSDEVKREIYDKKLQEVRDSEKCDVVSKEDFQDLQNYCAKVEKDLHILKDFYSKNKVSSLYNEQEAYNMEDAVARSNVEQSYYDGVNKAYHDAYINTLKGLGYKIKYKKTFKHYMKNLFALVLTAIIVVIVGYIVWNTPELRERVEAFLTF